jgi:hypothetical protein
VSVLAKINKIKMRPTDVEQADVIIPIRALDQALEILVFSVSTKTRT